MQYDKKLKIGVALLLLFVCTAMHGQSTPPEWFTYPKEGEYVGVSVGAGNGNDEALKSAEMSALMSYILQQETEGIVLRSLVSSLSDKEEAESILYAECAIEYELLRVEKGVDGHVWVAINPLKDVQKDAGILSLSLSKRMASEKQAGQVVDKHEELFLQCLYVQQDDAVTQQMMWASETKGELEPLNYFSFKIDTGDSSDNQGESSGDVVSTVVENTTLPNARPQNPESLDWMIKNASSKGYKGKTPYKGKIDNMGASYLQALSEALFTTNLYVFGEGTFGLGEEIKRKKVTKTYATFFHGNECFIFNDIVE